MADIDQALTWQGALCEQQYVADVDQATVWLRCTLQMTLCG